jgi:hypothetical protein
MSNLDDYPRLHVNYHDLDEWNRRGANAINRLLGDVGTVVDLIDVMYKISLENAILRGSTTWTGAGQLDNYSSSWAPTSIGDYTQNLTYDSAAGTITVGVDGIYTLSGYSVQTTGTNGQEYAVFATVNTVDTLLVGVNVWSNQANGYLSTASGSFGLTAGDVIALRVTNQTALAIAGSNLQVTLESLDAFS